VGTRLIAGLVVSVFKDGSTSAIDGLAVLVLFSRRWWHVAAVLTALGVLHETFDGLGGDADPLADPLVGVPGLVEFGGELATPLPGFS
jgi:hypothetical protein